ncbi:hypothetical protein C9374_003627 [Naegleria lovaniensis]|uniref:Uncharacterized protein n=1 Tax=Naegleria lovaniensis TaxID=51637 RepID=A0AA88KQ40_NAELO|nr:uncharacterized protein C9374_003627 [Naegleria lovaniensis]KAG2393863.1 hypothetical protein C9374_003627 [Naegleria lovaniensis]
MQLTSSNKGKLCQGFAHPSMATPNTMHMTHLHSTKAEAYIYQTNVAASSTHPTINHHNDSITLFREYSHVHNSVMTPPLHYNNVHTNSTQAFMIQTHKQRDRANNTCLPSLSAIHSLYNSPREHVLRVIQTQFCSQKSKPTAETTTERFEHCQKLPQAALLQPNPCLKQLHTSVISQPSGIRKQNKMIQNHDTTTIKRSPKITVQENLNVAHTTDSSVGEKKMAKGFKFFDYNTKTKKRTKRCLQVQPYENILQLQHINGQSLNHGASSSDSSSTTDSSLSLSSSTMEGSSMNSSSNEFEIRERETCNGCPHDVVVKRVPRTSISIKELLN